MTVTKAHITRQADEEEVPAKTVERDYVLANRRRSRVMPVGFLVDVDHVP